MQTMPEGNEGQKTVTNDSRNPMRLKSKSRAGQKKWKTSYSTSGYTPNCQPTGLHSALALNAD